MKLNKTRIKFLASHTGIHALLTIIILAVSTLFGSLFGVFAGMVAGALVGATLSIQWKELGEKSAAAKRVKGWINNGKNNLKLWKSTFTDSWTLTQWLAPALIVAVLAIFLASLW